MSFQISKYTHGFTLIEVLVALTIFTVSAVAVSSASMSYIKSTENLRNKTLAHFVAKNRMADIIINNEWSNQESMQRVANENGRGWQVQQKNIKTDSEELLRIELEIAPIDDDGKALNSITNYTFLYTKPSSSDNEKGFKFQ